MIALCLGVGAALAWGLHDFCVRGVSQSSGVFPSILTVFASGVVILIGVAVLFGDPKLMSAPCYQLSIASGLSFAVGGVALYIAFTIGPVRLVAPLSVHIQYCWSAGPQPQARLCQSSNGSRF